MNRNILGLDIRNDAISAVIVRSGIKTSRIEAHEHIPISDPNDIASCVDSLLKSLIKQRCSPDARRSDPTLFALLHFPQTGYLTGILSSLSKNKKK